MSLLLIAVGLLLLAGLLQGFAAGRNKAFLFTTLSAASAILLLIPCFQVLFSGAALSIVVNLPYPLGAVPLILDGLAAFFVLVIASIGFLAVLYSCGYLEPSRAKTSGIGAHYFFLALLIAFMVLVVVIQNALAFLIAWEIMSLASFFLVAYENNKKEVFAAAVNYLVAMHVGVVFLIAAFVLLTNQTGSMAFSDFASYFQSGGHPTTLLFIFFLCGFGTKAGFFPFHTWLPKAHPAAPGHISGLMSAIMIKTGLYGILRIIILMGQPERILGFLVLGVSLVSAVVGIVYAIAQRDTKRLLAYSSIENIGIAGIGLGIGMLGISYGNATMAALGFGGCLIHLLNHAIFKALLFFSVGSVYQLTHERNMEKMGGLIRSMPYTSFFSMLGCMAICGLPPLNGFIGKFVLFLALLSGILAANPLVNAVSILATAVLAFVGAASVLAFTRMFSVVFLGVSRDNRDNLGNRDNAALPGSPDSKAVQPHPVRDAAPAMLIPMGILALLSLAAGLFPYVLFAIVEKPLQLLLPANENLHGLFPLAGFAKISLVFFVFIALMTVLLLGRWFLLRHRTVTTAPTWGCGYMAPNSRMQYTGSSFARTFLLLFKPLNRMFFSLEEPESLFPKKGKLQTYFPDFVETGLINPLLKGIDRFFKLFHWVQGGATQQYILYGLLFLVAAILWILGG